MVFYSGKHELCVFIFEVPDFLREISDILQPLRIDVGVMLDGYFFSPVKLFSEVEIVDKVSHVFLDIADQKFRTATTSVAENPHFFSFHFFSF